MKKTPLLLLVFLLGCPPPVGPVNPISPPGSCEAAEAKLNELQCHNPNGMLIGGPNKHGETYSVRCKNNEANSIPQAPQCIAKITDCKEVNECLRALLSRSSRRSFRD